MLDQGRVRIVGPPGWQLDKRGADGMTLRYKLGDTGVIVVTVTPQQAALTREVYAKISKSIGQALREAARNEGAEFLIHPRVEPDNRFFLKVRDRTRGGDGKVRDQLQIYKALNLELIHIAAVAMVETEAESQPILAAAEEMLDNAKLGAGPKPSAFRRTRVRLAIPPDWSEQREDDPNGVVATYTNPAFPGARLVVRSKIIPEVAKGAAADPQLREHAIDELVDGYRNAPLPEGATLAGEQHWDHPRLERLVTRPVVIDGQPWTSSFRCRVVGDVAIGVAALAPTSDDAPAERMADAMALSIRSLDDKRQVLDLELSPAVAPAMRQMKPSVRSTRAPDGTRSTVTILPPTRPTERATTSPTTRPSEAPVALPR